MAEMTFGVIMFCLLSALAFAGTAWRVLAKKEAALSFSEGFLAASVVFSSVYLLNRVLFPAQPKTTAVCNLALLAGILFFQELKKAGTAGLALLKRAGPVISPEFKEKVRYLRPGTGKKQRLRAEAEALERLLERDPLNAFCFERLSEIHEKLGKHDRALAAAKTAVKLDPTVRNQWRVKDLRKEVRVQKWWKRRARLFWKRGR